MESMETARMRAYQTKAIDQVRGKMMDESHDSVVPLVLPTGQGKSNIFGPVAAACAELVRAG